MGCSSTSDGPPIDGSRPVLASLRVLICDSAAGTEPSSHPNAPRMTGIKQQVLRVFGDHGADTVRRYFAQIEYTAYWCIRMLRDAEGIDAVTPEGVEDLVVERRGVNELRQVKTRDESRGPWTTADALPVLCQQYHRRNAFADPCHFHFVSDQMADNKTSGGHSLGRLYRLKFLLDVEHDGQTLTDEEKLEMEEIEKTLIPKIRERLREEHGEDIDEATALSLLHDTWVETDSHILRSTEKQNLAELEEALAERCPGGPPLTMSNLKEVYGRLIILIARRITEGTTLESRRIERDDVMECRTARFIAADGYPDLDTVPGDSLLDKKARLGGFDPTELPRLHKQKALAEWTVRKLKSLGLHEILERLTTAIVDLQGVCRDKVCRQQGINEKPGPLILDMLRPELPRLAADHFPDTDEVNEQFCLGVLWGGDEPVHDLVARTGRPLEGSRDMRAATRTTESIAYHAARILLLISYCGKPRSARAASLPAVVGRTLLAKLDFFLRYPVYLKKAAQILGKEFADEDFGMEAEAAEAEEAVAVSVESRMVRYLYGPWDHIYYPALAYLIGKELITVENKGGTDVFRITQKGQEVSSAFAEDPVYADLVRRANTAYRLFNQFTGNRLKDFIYRHFPEVVSRRVGETI
jgi:hypothetical protein